MRGKEQLVSSSSMARGTSPSSFRVAAAVIAVEAAAGGDDDRLDFFRDDNDGDGDLSLSPPLLRVRLRTPRRCDEKWPVLMAIFSGHSALTSGDCLGLHLSGAPLRFIFIERMINVVRRALGVGLGVRVYVLVPRDGYLIFCGWNQGSGLNLWVRALSCSGFWFDCVLFAPTASPL